MDVIGEYKELPFPKIRSVYSDSLEIAYRKHSIISMFDLDITSARKAVHRYRNTTGGRLSFTAWMIKCISQAVYAKIDISLL